MKKLRVAIVIGHTIKGDKGAYSEILKLSEYDYNYEVATHLKGMANSNVGYDVYSHTIRDYGPRQSALAAKINHLNYDYVLELHFNAASPQANGTENLYYFSSEKGKKIAQILSKEISKEYKTTLRGTLGAKALVNSNDRGFGFVKKMKAPAVIVEPFFGSNIEASKFSNTSMYAKVLHNAIQKFP